MLKSWQKNLILAALVVIVAIWIWWWATSGFPFEGEICEIAKPPKNCSSHNVFLYSAYRLASISNEWGVLITAIATAVVAWFTATLWQSNRDQLAHNRRVERAYVKMSHNPPGLMISNDGSAIVLEIKNFGATSITKIAVDLKILTDDQILPLPPRYEEMRSVNFCTFLVADDRAFTQIEFDFSETTANAVPASSEVCVFGYVDYIDAFGQRHRGGYARMYRRTFGTENNLVFGTIHDGYNYDRERVRGEGNDWDN
jgi:hypothetical protein